MFEEKMSLSNLKTLLYALLLLPRLLMIRLFQKPSILCCFANIESVGGNELQYQLITTGLKQRNHALVALTLGPIVPDNRCIQYLRQHGVTHIPLLRPSPKINALVLKILGAKVLQLFNPSCGILIPAAVQQNVRIIYMEVGMPVLEDAFWQPIKPYMHQIHHIISVSKKACDTLNSDFGYQGSSTIIPVLIKPAPQGLRAKTHNSETFQIVYAGRLCPMKQLPLLIDAFAMVHQQYKIAKLSIIGEGSMKDQLVQQVNHLNITQAVTFHSWMSHLEIYDALRHADVFCLPSQSEGSPCSIAEAMSIGLAVIATDVGGIPEIITHGKTGLLVPMHDVLALKDALIQCIDEPHFKQLLGANAYEYHHQHRATELIFQSYEDVFKTLMA